MGLLMGFLGLIGHSLFSIDQARRKVKPNRYTPGMYLDEHGFALALAAIILIATYLVGIIHIQGIIEALLPVWIAEIIHDSENLRLLWFLWGAAVPTATKWYGTVRKTKDHDDD